MAKVQSSSNRILKNTFSLYIRMAFLTFISLFTVRIVLKELGAEDYGLYNVVGGFVTMFSFISGTLTTASQRYFAVCLASDDWKSLNKTFSVNFIIYVIFSVIILIIAETAGVWFVLNKLSIESGRETVALIVYQFSILTFLISLLISPFLALLVADENLSIYSIVSIIEGIFKILIVYLLYISPIDKLITYSVLLCLVSLGVSAFYFIYCKLKYKNIRISIYKDKKEYKSIFSYMNWNLIGAIAVTLKGQGVNVIMNMFFGTVINAARGIAFQINNTVLSFAQNFMKAVNPQITKKDALGEKEKLNKLLTSSSKFSFYLCYMIALPLIMNMSYVLKFWLGDVPEYTAIFTILALVDALIAVLTESIAIAVQSTGKVKVYQLSVGIISLCNLPTAYLLLKFFENPVIPFCVSIGITIVVGIGRLINYSKLRGYSIINYVKKVLVPVLIICCITIIFNYFMCSQAKDFLNLIINCFISVIFSVVVIFFVGMDRSEKKLVLSFLKRRKEKK